VERLLSRALISFAAAAAAMILVAAATLFLGAALYLLLISMSVAPPLTALLVGLAGFSLAGLIVAAVRLTWRRAPTRLPGGSNRPAAAADLAGNANDLAAQLGTLAARELTSQAQAHPYRTVVVSLLAGLAVGGSPALRNAIENMLKS
jgi:xanthosine utilization system XapX-like protein